MLTTAGTSSRKLNLMYLANEVAQQSRARKKDEFPKAFGGVIAEAMEIAYRGSSNDIQGKLRRVLEVWRSRGVFEPPILSAIDQRLDGTPSHQLTQESTSPKEKG
jgi:regulator of Ty1 transposition protein 103